MQLPEQCPPLEDVGLRSLVWVFVGLIYGFIFVAMAEATRAALGTPYNFLFATLVTPALTALFYSSMRLAVIIANVALLSAVLILMLGGHSGMLSQVLLILVPALLGMLAGAGYGWRDRRSRVCCADAKTIGGLFSGLLSLVPGTLVIGIFGGSNAVAYPWLVMLLAPLAGALYVTSACWFVRRLQNLLPPVGDGALVGLGVGAITGLLFVVIAATFDPDFTGQGSPLEFIEQIHAVLGTALLGAVAGCLVLGIVRAVMRMPWYRL